MPLQELKEQIQEEIEANPALEIVSDASTVSLESLPESEPRESENSSPFENSSDPGFYSHSGSDDDSKRMFIEGAIARPETLQEHLLWQLRLQRIGEGSAPSARSSSRTSTTTASTRKTLTHCPQKRPRKKSTRPWTSCAASSPQGPVAPIFARASSSRPRFPATPQLRLSPSFESIWSSSRRASTRRSRSA